MAEKVLVGTVRHFYDRAGVAAIELSGDLAVGDTVSIEHGTESFEQRVGSMQMDHKSVQGAKSGESIGIKVDRPTGEGASVYRLV